MTDPREERMRMAKHLTSLVFEELAHNNSDWMFSEDHTVKIISDALRDWHKFA